MTGKLRPQTRVPVAWAIGVALIALAFHAEAQSTDRLRESLSRRPSGEVTGPPLARYVSEDGHVFVLDRTQPVAMLKFEDSPEVWALEAAPAPRGDVIYKNDLGEPMLRATRLGGFTLFTDDRPSGEAVSMAGVAGPLRMLALSPQAVFERLTQASARSSRAAHRPMLFEAEATPASSALIADAATITSVAILKLAQSPQGRAMLARFSRVRFEEGKKPSASLKDGILRIVVAPAQGVSGRPSSDRILQAASTK